ncbi:ABC transporter substrate-binding protein [Neobittarella massiliensis]|uniref:ABC transporter substrate-binding protein n=1 Tax=Neobittarella massiliensis (ex Bilen et al. 2018) TaxID=2041842 RepID=UPI000CF711EC|nr:ABC transporter substrate-binding protein [Neobittarella massiliensis]
MKKIFAKRAAAALLAGTLALSVFTGCGDSKETGGNTGSELDPENPTKVTFYSYSLTYPSMKPGMEHLIQEFNDTVGKEKGVIVEGVPDANMSKYKSDIQAGQQVDIVQHGWNSLDDSKENMGIKAYEDVFPKDELEEHFSGMEQNAVKLGQIDGKTYGLAFTFSTPILYINGTLFEQAGLDPNDPPKTWDEVLAAAKQIKEKTGKDGFGLSPQNGWVTEGVIFSNGGSMLNSDRTKATFASKEGVEAISKWKEFFTSGVAALGTDSEVSQAFMAGNVGMHIQSTSLLSGILSSAEAGGWKVYGAAMPSFGEKTPAPVNSGSCLAVRPDSDLKAKAIWEFIKYVTGDEGYTIITSEIGYLPLRTYLADDEKYLKSFVDENPLVRVNIDQLKNVKPVTIWPAGTATECFTIFTDAITRSLTTDADVEETLKEAQSQIDKILAQQ